MTTGAVETVDMKKAQAQSLATGTAGMALLDVERALNGTGRWTSAVELIRSATSGTISAADEAGLYYGLPSICFLLHAGASDGAARFRTATMVADQHAIAVIERRIAVAVDRRAQGAPLSFKEYDLFYGLVGLSSLMTRSMSDSPVLPSLLSYLVALTTPRRKDDLCVPGWWVEHDPDPILPTPGGHANLGMAHGAAGLLAALSLAISRGIEVRGQREAIYTIVELFDRWRQDGPGGPWWPQWLTSDDLRSGNTSQRSPGRISWCYGVPGITRALQLAAHAVGDNAQQAHAEQDLAANLTDAHLAAIGDAGLCHGVAGVYQTAWRVAQDATTSEVADRLPAVAAQLIHHSQSDAADDAGLLTGRVGLELALETHHHGSPRSGWDACLLIN